MLDELLLLDIYPARELPIEGVTSQIIFDRVTIEKKRMLHKEEVLEQLEQMDDMDIIVTFGAGDVDRLIPSIKELAEKRNAK